MSSRTQDSTPSLTPHEALVFAMVLVSAADRNMTDRELKTIGRIVTVMPAFVGFDRGSLPVVADRCVAVLQHPEGVEHVFAMIGGALTPALCETAYAFACDVAAADGTAVHEEMRVLEMMRHHLDIDRLAAAAIERGARARYGRVG